MSTILFIIMDMNHILLFNHCKSSVYHTSTLHKLLVESIWISYMIGVSFKLSFHTMHSSLTVFEFLIIFWVLKATSMLIVLVLDWEMSFNQVIPCKINIPNWRVWYILLGSIAAILRPINAYLNKNTQTS